MPIIFGGKVFLLTDPAQEGVDAADALGACEEAITLLRALGDVTIGDVLHTILNGEQEEGFLCAWAGWLVVNMKEVIPPEITDGALRNLSQTKKYVD